MRPRSLSGWDGHEGVYPDGMGMREFTRLGMRE